MKVEIIAVGNEVVTGSTINTNASYIATEIEQVGLTPRWHTSVGDYKEDVAMALDVSLKRAEIIVFTGGLGPTEDDLTKECVGEYLGIEMVLDQKSLERIKKRFEELGKDMPKANIKQAYFPKGCTIIENNNGTAPGCMIQYEGRYIILLPGPPKELKPMVSQFVLPYFREMFEGVYHKEELRIFGMGESHLVEKIGEFLGEENGVIVAPYIGKNEIIIRIKALGKDKETARQKALGLRKDIEGCIPSYVIGYNEKGLEELIVEKMLQKGYTVATAESCTGGLLAATLINVGGVSSCYKEGVITYSNAAKIKRLGVKEETLQDFGAVSTQTALEMAKGVREQTGADVGLSTTGIAGPGGGTPTKPVGLVYVAVSMKDGGEEVWELRLRGSRIGIRERAVKELLYNLFLKLK